ncbi:hypothetical protein LXL04_013585 [Taraxacum kok-saghyz]
MALTKTALLPLQNPPSNGFSFLAIEHPQQLASAEDFQQPDLAYPPIIDHSNPKTNQRRPHLLVPRSEVCCSGETIRRFSSSVHQFIESVAESIPKSICSSVT